MHETDDRKPLRLGATNDRKVGAASWTEGMPANVGIETGPKVLSALGGALEDLHEEVSVPIMARRQWLDTWIRCYSDYEPLAVYVEGARGLEAVALLARIRRRGVLQIVRMGHGVTDHARFPSRGQDSANVLARAVSSHVEATRGPWHLLFGQLPVDDPVARATEAMLSTSACVPGDASPTVRFGPSRSIDDYVPRKLRSNLRTRMNRLNREGLSADFDRFREPDDIARLLPETERVRRERDAFLRRESKLDDPRYLSFRRAALSELSRRREVEITTLRIQGELAAYQVALLDGDVYRQWDSRFSPAWGRFAPGSQLNTMTLRWVLEDPRFRELDFMRGTHAHKLEFATEIAPTETLEAWSSPIVRGATAIGAGLTRSIRSAKRRLGTPS